MLQPVERKVAISVAVCLVSVAALVLLVGPGPAKARPKDTADFTYKVTKVDYALRATTSASRESSVCVAGVTQDIGGTVTTSPAELGNLNLGEGELHIERDGTRGVFDATESFDFNFTGSQLLTTLCEDGTTAASSFKQCNETRTSDVALTGFIRGPVGDAVRVTFEFQAGPQRGGWSPNLICNETVEFVFKPKCKSASIALEKMTRRRVKVPFLCAVPLRTDPPAGKGYDRYEALANLSGYVKLKAKPED